MKPKHRSTLSQVALTGLTLTFTSAVGGKLFARLRVAVVTP